MAIIKKHETDNGWPGEYWVITRYEWDKAEEHLAVYLKLYKDADVAKKGGSPMMEKVLTFDGPYAPDFVRVPRALDPEGANLVKALYKFIVAEVPFFEGGSEG